MLHECGVTHKEDTYGIEAEVISGLYATQIIIYQSMMKSRERVYHAVWHELGHIMFGNYEDFKIDIDLDTPLRSGYAVVNEFMVEYIAFFINNGMSCHCSRR